MSISPDNAAAIVCREVFDETSHPSNEEVFEYAKRLGIDPNAEPHLLDLARKGLMAALPKGWSPIYLESMGTWYYYHASTGTTTWEHPLDAVYRDLVKEARAGNTRQTSVEDDSKTTARELDSHEEATLPNETSPPKETEKPKLNPVPTRIPTKLAPLKRVERDGTRKKSPGGEKGNSKRDPSKAEHLNPLAMDRASRDYTNLRFQDPKFYECPKLLSSTATTNTSATTPTTTTTANTSAWKEMDLKEVLKRSESLSPRHEKDWEQLSSKFSSEENIIDIDKLSGSALARSEKPEKFDKEKHPNQFGQPKELTLSGGGTMFLKSNRSRDTTPSQDEGKLEDFRAMVISEEASNVVGDRLKSILREKQTEDEDKPAEEERKSVRFDLEKEVDIKFTYSGSDDESDESESDGQNVEISTTLINKVTGAVLPPQRFNSENYDEDTNSESKNQNSTETNPFLEKHSGDSIKNSKIVGKRFLVQNVSENEHLTQVAKENSLSRDSSLDFIPNKFENVKNIDIVSKSDTDSSFLKSSEFDGTKNKFATIKPKKSAIRFAQEQLNDSDQSSELHKMNHNMESLQQEQYNKIKIQFARNFDEMKAKLSKQYEKDVENLKKEFEAKLEQSKKELEENFLKEKMILEGNLKEKLEEVRREMAEKEEQEIQKLIAEMDVARLENLKKVKVELETCYEKERQSILTNLKTELDERKRELLELRNQEMGKLENEHERDLGEEKRAKQNELELTKAHTERIEALKKDLDKEFNDLRNDLRAQQHEKITKMTEDHEKCLADILREFRIDEGLARKMYKQRLEEIRADITRNAENEARRQIEQSLQQGNADFEKMRCEKRLLQDKYADLKVKYTKLKDDVRLAMERRSRRKEGYATTSETEMSASTRTRTDRTDSTDQNTSLRNVRSISSATTSRAQEVQTTSEEAATEQLNQEDSKTPNYASNYQTNVYQSKSSKCESNDTITTSESNATTSRKAWNNRKKNVTTTKSPVNGSTANNVNNNNNNNNNLENPVENIRKQLEKLEDLGDQLPSNETAYTLRYPFQDKAPANASSELEFFWHRLHVEKDSVRRAREALRHQRNAFQGRQRAWKQRSARATLQQLVQEERELSDMEVSLHRTRSLLGEKVIHLRHLEQSLERVANANTKRTDSDAGSTKNDELTLSDMSSASSGFSSTDLGIDTFIDKPDHYQESTEIIASLENLNSEIREIWGVLNKRQDSNVPPPSTLMQSYLRWLRFHQLTSQPTNVQGAFGTPNIQSNILSQLTAAQPPATTTQNIIAQYGPNSGFTTSVGTVDRNGSNLVERTRNLRDWLRQARVETTDLVTPGQATL